jgi:hypothetical protein
MGAWIVLRRRVDITSYMTILKSFSGRRKILLMPGRVIRYTLFLIGGITMRTLLWSRIGQAKIRGLGAES